jgi:glycosyltransferase involved in cell wall biosynthesis
LRDPEPLLPCTDPLVLKLRKVMIRHDCISVILPIYNGERYLAATIESILSQTYQHYEIIAVNDGSHDCSAEIVKRYFTSGRLKYIEQVNQGVANARNTGIEHSSGEFVAFVDQDDLWSPDKLEKQIAYMQAHADVALVHGRVECIDGDGARISCEGRVYVDDTSGYCAERLLTGNRIAVPTVMVRRSCLNAVGFLDQTFAPSDDWHLWLRLALRFPFGFLDEVLATYRVHDSNESRHVLKMRLAEIHVLESIRSAYSTDTLSMNRQALDSSLIRYYEGAAALLSQAGSRDEASSLRRKVMRMRLCAPWYYADLFARLFPIKSRRYVLWYCHRFGALLRPHRRHTREFRN